MQVWGLCRANAAALLKFNGFAAGRFSGKQKSLEL
jgi:hypothetical protein